MKLLRNMPKLPPVSSAVISCLYKYVRDSVLNGVERQHRGLGYNHEIKSYPTWMSETMYGFDVSKPKRKVED